MKLLRRDIAGVAKKELEYTPMGPIFKALGAIFIDRSDKSKAIAAMKPAIEALKSGTSIVIAHRLATIKQADKIIVMDKGLIVEEGTHAELLVKEGGYYKNLYDKQFSLEIAS